MTWHRRVVASSAQNLDVGPVMGSSRNGFMESEFGKTYPAETRCGMRSLARGQ
jgi:hypothetical protein